MSRNNDGLSSSNSFYNNDTILIFRDLHNAISGRANNGQKERTFGTVRDPNCIKNIYCGLWLTPGCHLLEGSLWHKPNISWNKNVCLSNPSQSISLSQLHRDNFQYLVSVREKLTCWTEKSLWCSDPADQLPFFIAWNIKRGGRTKIHTPFQCLIPVVWITMVCIQCAAAEGTKRSRLDPWWFLSSHKIY